MQQPDDGRLTHHSGYAMTSYANESYELVENSQFDGSLNIDSKTTGNNTRNMVSTMYGPFHPEKKLDRCLNLMTLRDGLKQGQKRTLSQWVGVHNGLHYRAAMAVIGRKHCFTLMNGPEVTFTLARVRTAIQWIKPRNVWLHAST